MIKRIAIATFAAGMVFAGHVQADQVVNNGDSWARQADPGATFAGDFVSVWSTGTNDGGGANARWGVLSFDLGGHASPISAVSLNVWSFITGSSGDSVGAKVSAIAIDPGAVANPDAASWNEVSGAGVLHTFGGLGTYDVAATNSDVNLQDVFLESVGTGADAAFVESVRTGSGDLLIVLIADEDTNSYKFDVGDGELGGLDAFLNTNADVIPEPASLALLGLGGLMMLRRRR